MNFNSSAILYYWPSGHRGGKSVGHVAVMLGNGAYLSHVPERTVGGANYQSWTRDDIPTMPGQRVKVQRRPSMRDRTLDADLVTYGPSPQQMTLPPLFVQLPMAAFAAGRMLVSAPGAEPLHGPLPYYQLADSVKDVGDRSQCATTIAKMLSHGLPLTHQEVGAEILSTYDPDALWDLMQTLVKKLG